MLSINKIMLTGRLTRDPETKFLPSGNAVTKIAMAVSRRFQDRSGEWREEVFYMDVETYGKSAERLGETLRKGSPVYVEGRLRQESWEKDGQKMSKWIVTADRVSGFEVPTRQGSESAGALGNDNYHSAAPSEPRAARPQGRPSNLEFPPAEDDIPF
jgi:single-strand DNA-binding protein